MRTRGFDWFTVARRRTPGLLVLAACAGVPLVLRAQDVPRTRSPVLAGSDVAIVGVGVAASAVLVGWDRAIADGARASPLQGNHVVGGIMDGMSAYGSPGVLAAGVALWVSGYWPGSEARRLVGLRSLEAVIATGAVTSVLKGVMGRARPDESPGNSRDFVLGRGIGDRSEFQSFPSGHTTAAFAFASVVDAEWARLRPGRSRLVPAMLYAAAALTGAARVYRDRHWASDVVMGGVIGFVGGRAVVRWHADKP